MFHRRQETRDHFWAGFCAGAVAGGVLGVLFASEVGRSARARLESAVDEVRSRFNGKTGGRQAESEEAGRAEGLPS